MREDKAKDKALLCDAAWCVLDKGLALELGRAGLKSCLCHILAA